MPGTGVGLGTDPSLDGFGSTRLKAESTTWSINPIHDHSHYYALGSESMFSMADIVSGHGDALELDGMTAGHRIGIPGDIFDNLDLENRRIATGNHYHAGPGG